MVTHQDLFFFLSSSLSSSAQAGSSSAELREGKGEKKKLFLARQPGLLGGGGGGELGGHPRLHVVGRHARGGHGGLEVALFRRTDKLKKKGKKKVAFFVRGRLGPAAATAAGLTF